ncbi:MAG: thioredoxin-disulfide reductase [Candidatus Delongbacteria bacterium]|nr:thioredoxin-disulfide reductase [Candidatus Delongbacteria bacterium]MCG2760993.1 thioredoxin-disulfide reductase [Candidatus Delongbacteria bacterium]
MYDLIIIGGGPAGLTAGMYAARSKLNVVMLEKMMPGGNVSITAEVENYPGIPNIGGPDLVMQMEKQARDFGLEIRSEEVLSIEVGAGTNGHSIKSDTNEYKTKSVLIASGSSPRRIGCQGEDEHIGRGVSYCATCDGAFFREKHIAVVGGGDSAVEEGLYLTKFAKRVTIIHRRDRLRADKIIQEKAIKHPKIDFIWDSVIEGIEGTPVVNNIKIKNLKSSEVTDFKVDGVFVFVGYIPGTDYVPGIVNKDEGGYIITDLEMRTNIPGIFAAGDIIAKKQRQIVTACGDAATAIKTIEHYNEWYYEDEQYL